MKRIFLLLSAIFLISACSSGQWYSKYYPDRQLSDLNYSELQILNKKAVNMRSTGITLFTVGTIFAGGGSFTVIVAAFIDLGSLIETGETKVNPVVYRTGFAFLFIGMGIALAGIPVWTTGGNRVKEISILPNFRSPNTSIAITPSMQFLQCQNRFIPGATLSIRF